MKRSLSTIKTLYRRSRDSVRKSKLAQDSLPNGKGATKRDLISFRELTDEELGQLAGILAHEPSPEEPLTASQRQAYKELNVSQVEKLPARLRTSSEQNEPLCQAHEGLNPDVVRTLLQWIQHEVEVGIPRVLYAVKDSELLSKTVQVQFNELREVCAMWMLSDEYIRVFGRRPNPRWRRQPDQCPGCTLARIGGEEDILTTLKAGMLVCTATAEILTSRKHMFLDAWIAHGFDEVTAERTHKQAKRIADHVKEVARSLFDTPEASEEVRNAAEDAMASPTQANDHNKADDSMMQPYQSSATVNNIIDQYASMPPYASQLVGEGAIPRPPYSPYTPVSFQPGFSASHTSFYGLSEADSTNISMEAYDEHGGGRDGAYSASQHAARYTIDLEVDAFLRELDEEAERERNDRRPGSGGWI